MLLEIYASHSMVSQGAVEKNEGKKRGGGGGGISAMHYGTNRLFSFFFSFAYETQNALL